MVDAKNKPIPPPLPPRPSRQPNYFPIVDMTAHSLNVAQQIISNSSITTGVVIVRNLPMRPNFAAVQRLFDKLYRSPELADRVNSLFPARKPYKLAGKWNGDNVIDNKATIDIGIHQLRAMRGEAIKQDLGTDFETAVNFFREVKQRLVPLIISATSDGLSNSTNHNLEFWDLHRQGNMSFRLIDYHRTAESPAPGARPHKDLTTFTIIFQDGSGGLEIQNPTTGQWNPVPGNETLVMWGRASEVLSGGYIRAANHRVAPIHSMRRNVLILFVHPDLGTRYSGPLMEALGNDMAKWREAAENLRREIPRWNWNRR